MGGAVGKFLGNVAKTVAKGATTALGGMIPVVGPALAQGVNSLYAKGGKVLPRFEAGGEVPAGMKAKVINTPAQLIAVIKQFPAEAAKANLSVQDVKDAVAELKAPAMAHGGMVHHAHHAHHAHHGHHAHHDMAHHGMYECMEHGGMEMHDMHSKHASHNPKRHHMGMGMMYNRGGEAPSMARGGMSGQRASARGYSKF